MLRVKWKPKFKRWIRFFKTYESFTPFATTFVVTLMAAIFGTIIYFRPATIATDWGGDDTFASNDCVVFAVCGILIVMLPYILLLSSFEFRLPVALLPLWNAVDCAVVLLFRHDRSRCFITAFVVVSELIWVLPVTDVAVPVTNSVVVFCASAAANSLIQRCVMEWVRRKMQIIRKWDTLGNFYISIQLYTSQM